MAQHDYDLANAAGAVFRADINSVLSAVVSLNSGGTEPTVKFAHMFWMDTANSILKKRNAANTAWTSVLEFIDGSSTVDFLGSLDISGLTTGTDPAVADTVPFYDASAAATKQITLANLLKVITLLTAETAPAIADELLLYDASASTADKITLENLFKVVNGFTEDTAPDDAADFIPIFDTSASAIKKVKPSNLAASGGITTIASGSLAGTAVSIIGIPATYSKLILQVTGASSTVDTRRPLVQIDTDNGASFDSVAANYRLMSYNGGTALDNVTDATIISCDTSNLTTDTWDFTVAIQSYHAGPKMALISGMSQRAGDGLQIFNGGHAKGTAAINALQILWNGSGSFDAGTYALYGVR